MKLNWRTRRNPTQSKQRGVRRKKSIGVRRKDRGLRRRNKESNKHS